MFQKEIKTHKYRVGLTPGAVREYLAAGHTVVIETDAGVGAADQDYRKAGAAIVGAAHEVFASSEMIVKVKEPQRSEWALYERTGSSSPTFIWRVIQTKPKAL